MPEAMHGAQQSLFKLAAQNDAGALSAEIRFVHGRIEAVEAECSPGIQSANNRQHFDGQPGGGVHGNMEGDKVRFTKPLRR